MLARLTPKGLHLLRDSRPLVQEGLRRHFLDHIDAGVLYVNRRAGATTSTLCRDGRG